MATATRERSPAAPAAAPDSSQLANAEGSGRQRRRPAAAEIGTRGFGSGASGRSTRRRPARRRSPALSKADWGPLGKHPDREAIVARQRLHLPLAGRISADDVNRAWKSAAAEHHPDRGGRHDTMQRVNGARDLLLGRDGN